MPLSTPSARWSWSSSCPTFSGSWQCLMPTASVLSFIPNPPAALLLAQRFWLQSRNIGRHHNFTLAKRHQCVHVVMWQKWTRRGCSLSSVFCYNSAMGVHRVCRGLPNSSQAWLDWSLGVLCHMLAVTACRNRFIFSFCYTLAARTFALGYKAAQTMGSESTCSGCIGCHPRSDRVQELGHVTIVWCCRGLDAALPCAHSLKRHQQRLLPRHIWRRRRQHHQLLQLAADQQVCGSEEALTHVTCA